MKPTFKLPIPGPASRRGGASIAATPVIASIAAIAATTLGCGNDSASDARGPGPAGRGNGARSALPTMTVAVDTAETGDIADHYTSSATLDAEKQAVVEARVSGVITSIAHEEGDRVEAGAMLMRIDDTEYTLRVREAEAEAARLTSKFERAERMWNESFISQEEYEQAVNDRAAAEATLELAKLEQSYTSVRAPFAGRVVTRHVDVGQTVNPGDPLFTVVDLSRLLARVAVPAKEFRSIRIDQPVSLVVGSSGTELRGRVHLVSPIIDPSSGTIKVTVSVADFPSDTRPGDFAEVSIVTETRERRVLVPRNAVLADRGEDIVYVATADSTAERRVVTVGFRDDSRAEIVSGLEHGEPVVVQGQRALRHGQPLRILAPMEFEDAPEDSARAS